MLKNNLRVNNLYYQTNSNNTAAMSGRLGAGGKASSQTNLQSTISHSHATLAAGNAAMDAYNQHHSHKHHHHQHRRTTSSSKHSKQQQHGFAKNFLALDCSMATKTSHQAVKGPQSNEKAHQHQQQQKAQQVWNAKQQYENCCLNTQMLRGLDKSRSLSSCSQYNP